MQNGKRKSMSTRDPEINRKQIEVSVANGIFNL